MMSAVFQVIRVIATVAFGVLGALTVATWVSSAKLDDVPESMWMFYSGILAAITLAVWGIWR